MKYGLFVLVLLCAACIPSRTPPQLSFTPGAPAVITPQTYANLLYRVTYPGGWRVITSAVESPYEVTFAAPDNQTLMRFSVNPVAEAPSLPGVAVADVVFESVALGTHTIYAVLVTTHKDAMLPEFTRALASVASNP